MTETESTRLPATMRGAFLLGPRAITVRDTPVPTIGPDEVLVRVTTALTCGTELKAYRQGHRLFKPPMPLGHEFVGVVAQVGEAVSSVRVGDRVTAANSAPCDACAPCLRGRTNLCLNLASHLLFGAFAEYVRIPSHIVAHNLLLAPAGVPDETLAFVEPLACVVLGMEVVTERPGNSVVVIGGTGPIGLLFVQLLKRAAFAQIVAVGRKPHRLALARTLGATDTIDATEGELVDRVRALTGGPDLVIDITGAPELIAQAVLMPRPGGRVILFGGSEPGATAAIDVARVHYEEVALRGVFHHTPRTVRRAFALLIDGVIDTRPLVSGRFALDETATAMARFDSGDTMKLAICPRGSAIENE